MYLLVRDLATDGFPVVVTCRVLGFSTQGFYTLRRLEGFLTLHRMAVEADPAGVDFGGLCGSPV